MVLNEKLLKVMGDEVTQEQAFAHANDMLKNAVADSRNAMNALKRYAADDAHVIFGTAYDEGLGDQPPAPCLIDASSTPTLHQRRGHLHRPAFLGAMSVQGPARRNRQARQESIEAAG